MKLDLVISGDLVGQVAETGDNEEERRE